MTFDAEMTSAADMSQFQSTFDNGWRALYSNGEAQAYADYDDPSAPNPYSFSNGALNITASPTPYYGQPYVSGMLSTDHNFAQSYGYFEARIDTPGDKGFWPAFWMLPDGGAGLPEIDIMEQPNNNGANSYWNYVSAITSKSGGFVDAGTNLSSGYHTYGVLWTASTIQFSLDGNLIGDPIATEPSLMGQKMYMLLNLAVGNASSWPGATAPGASATVSVDYIRAYSNDPNATAITPAPVSTPGGSAPPPPPVITMPTDQTIGSGPDSFVLKVSEDAFQGDAQFTISVDGKQVGGTLSTTALKSAGQTQNIIVKGTFGTDSHAVNVSFLNDAWGGADTADRNFYVNGATYNGASLSPTTANLFDNGTAGFTSTSTTQLATTTPTVISLGTAGPNTHTFLLGVSEDAYQGDAQFTVTVDGQQYGGTLTTSASHASGQSQSIVINGDFDPAPQHTAQITFQNDAYGGAGVGMDRNLYVDAASFDGSPTAPNSGSLFSNGSLSFMSAAKAGQDKLSLAMTEDAYQGDAQAEISLDGTVLGNVTVTAPNSGSPQLFNFVGNFGTGAHSVGVKFTNDANGSDGDRNLFVQGATFDGVSNSDATASLFWNQQVNFNI
jgi:beta-glucanase (GH16 family)